MKKGESGKKWKWERKDRGERMGEGENVKDGGERKRVKKEKIDVKNKR